MPFLILTLFSALIISLVAGWFSISGLVAIFPDATIPIICMGVALEISKLVAASFVYKHWNTAKLLARTYLLVAVIILSCITSVGVYGFLSRTNLAGNAAVGTGQDRIAFVQKSIDRQVGDIKAESTALAQMNRVVSNYLTDTSKATTAETVRNRQAKERQRSQDKIDKANTTILALQLQKDSLVNVQRTVEIHTGPLLYLAQLFGTSAEKMVRWFILIIVFVMDPLALCLTIGANIQAQNIKTTKTTIEPLIAVKNDKDNPIQRLYDGKLPEWVERNNAKQRERIEQVEPSSDFGFTSTEPDRPILQVIHPPLTRAK